MAGDGIQIEGLSRTFRELQRLGVEVNDLKDVMASIARLGAGAASRRVPRRSGRLAGSIRGNRAKGRATISAGRASLPYAGPIEYGWPRRGIAPANFMTGAAAEIAPQAPALFEHGVNQAIKRRGLA